MGKRVTEKWVPFTKSEEKKLIGVGCEIDGNEAEVFVGDERLLVIRKVDTGGKRYVYQMSLSDTSTDTELYPMGTYAYMNFKSLLEDIVEPFNDDLTNKFDKEAD